MAHGGPEERGLKLVAALNKCERFRNGTGGCRQIPPWAARRLSEEEGG